MTTTLAELISGAAARLVQGPPETPITSIVDDSRLAGPCSLFVARSGTELDGRRFIDDALNRGAVAVLTDHLPHMPEGVAVVLTDNVPHTAAILAERFYGQPCRRLRLVGVTGTNGKTTTSHLIHQLLVSCDLRQQRDTPAAPTCGLIGTVEVRTGRARHAASLTTPPALEVSRLLRSMVDAGCSTCVVEASSHALRQQRLAALNFRVGIFTNLSGDHLDYHGTVADYAAAKALLFQQLSADGLAIINQDDPHWPSIIADSRARIMRCSLRDSATDCFAEVRNESMTGFDARFRGPWGTIEASLPLIGRHNAMNALQAIAATHALGSTAAQLKDALGCCEAPPGRLERIGTADLPFAVYVDYAHTDDALANVLRALKPLVPAGGRLRLVFGCGGDRDRTKRPRMAKVAGAFADEIIITSDNPRSEDPDAIIQQVFAGIPSDRRESTTCVTDRATAIQDAIRRAEPGDLVLIAGKGHETYQIIGKESRPFDDRLVAAEALASTRPRAAETEVPLA